MNRDTLEHKFDSEIQGDIGHIGCSRDSLKHEDDFEKDEFCDFDKGEIEGMEILHSGSDEDADAAEGKARTEHTIVQEKIRSSLAAAGASHK